MPTPTHAIAPAPIAHTVTASADTVTPCSARATTIARGTPSAAGIECNACERSNATSGSAYRMSNPPDQLITATVSAINTHQGSLHAPVTARYPPTGAIASPSPSTRCAYRVKRLVNE